VYAYIPGTGLEVFGIECTLRDQARMSSALPPAPRNSRDGSCECHSQQHRVDRKLPH